MTPAIGVEPECPFTPSLLKKVVYAAVRSASFVQASQDLAELAEQPIPRERVQRWSKRVGQARSAEVVQATADYQALPLPPRRRSPTPQVPQVACVQMDGGRIQVRPRAAARDQDSGHWREVLVGCCLSMTSQEYREDPSPTIPSTFVDPQRISQLSREIKGFSQESPSLDEEADADLAQRVGQPEILVRSVIATREGLDAFGPRLGAAAYARGFNAAGRKAFVADGGASNWSVHAQHFSHYTPILDFVHALMYVYAAAMAGCSAEQGWSDYCCWAQWLWSGQIAPLIEALSKRAEALGLAANNGETSPRQIVAESLRYMRNQRSRMNYAEYRRQGLPITSSHVESTIKQINRRMKGSEKFWDQGTEPLLQLAADYLSETPDLRHFWQHRPRQLETTRSYQIAV